jgi:DNA polymerase I-like protein with 3'-5' exonuclease and polymerase domains
LKQADYFLPLPLKAADFWAIDWSDNLEMLDRLAVYCKQDIRATHSLYKTIQKRLPEECVEAYFLMEQPMLAVLMDLESTGALLDKPLLDTLLVDASAEVERLEAEISASVGLMPVLQYDKEDDSYVPADKTYKKGYYNNKTHVPPYYTTPDGIMVRSWEGHIDDGSPLLLYDHCQLVPFNSAAATGHTYWVIARDCKEALEFAGKTKKGKPQINKDFIKEVDGLLPASFPIGKLAKANKRLQMATTLNNNLGADNRIRCDFAHTRTLTGRLATSNPNLQNIPRPGESEDSKVFRKLFIAKPGCTLLCADFAAIELRALAYFLSIVEGDEELASVFSSEKADAHTANATRWGVSRTVAKTLIFLLIYGGQPKLMFARKLFPTIEEAEKAFEGVHESQPSIRRLMAKVIADATKKGYVKSLLGRHMHYPDLKSANKWDKLKAERQTFNALIQGSSRDILHYLLGESLPVVLEHKAHFVNVVHDEVVIEVPLEQKESLLQALDGIWNNRTDFLGSLPITGEWNSGSTWYSAK